MAGRRAFQEEEENERTHLKVREKRISWQRRLRRSHQSDGRKIKKVVHLGGTGQPLPVE